MTQKIWLLPLLLVLLIGASAATFTVTWNDPAENYTTANNAANRPGKIDFNFTVVDTNASVSDVNIHLGYFRVGAARSTLVDIVALADWNGGATDDADMNCVGSGWDDPGKDCTYKWTIPLDTVMVDGEWFVDANVVSFDRDGNELYDSNAARIIVISNRLSNAGALRALMGNINLIIIAAILLGILSVGILLRPDMITFVTMSVAIAIAGGIGGMIIGAVIAQI